MAVITVSGIAGVADLPNYVGELYRVRQHATPFLNRVGSLAVGGGRVVEAPEFGFQEEEIPTGAGQATDARLEGADAPTPTEYGRRQITNVVEKFHESFGVTYTKSAAVGYLGETALRIEGENPIRNEVMHQLELTLALVARKVNYMMINGTYAKPADPEVNAWKSRGMLEAIQSNVVTANGAALAKEHIDRLLVKCFESGGFQDPSKVIIWCNAYQRQCISDIYGIAPRDRELGGVNIQQIMTTSGTFGIEVDYAIPADTIMIVDHSVVWPVFLLVRGEDGGVKGVLFAEPLGRKGAFYQYQLYGEIGLYHGPEMFHGKITGLKSTWG
jgi:hypothetical protein